jgi:hypothetical protein
MTAISPRRSPKYTMNTLDVEFNLIKPIYINTIYPIVRLILGLFNITNGHVLSSLIDTKYIMPKVLNSMISIRTIVVSFIPKKGLSLYRYCPLTFLSH